ncbi:MAG: hypothetical protein H0X62_04575 [Bacteroidetes bacterium]|nr:hypothetical protein [Bacteroidota bacterium]
MSENITLKKIYHRGFARIGIFFPIDHDVIAKVKAMKAVFSKTHKCWYVDYGRNNFNALMQEFPAAIIEKEEQVEKEEKESKPKIEPGYGNSHGSRDNAHIGSKTEPKFRAQEQICGIEHKAETLDPDGFDLPLENPETIYTHLSKKVVDRIQSPLDNMVQIIKDKKKLE